MEKVQKVFEADSKYFIEGYLEHSLPFPASVSIIFKLEEYASRSKLTPGASTPIKNARSKHRSGPAFLGCCSSVEQATETSARATSAGNLSGKNSLEASEYIPVEKLGTTDDCGFSAFSDDTSTNRDTAFAKIQARARGTTLAEKLIRDDL